MIIFRNTNLFLIRDIIIYDLLVIIIVNQLIIIKKGIILKLRFPNHLQDYWQSNEKHNN